MIEIHPDPYNQFTFRDSDPKTTSLEEVVFTGKHVLAKCHCDDSNYSFYHTFPVGYDLWFPISFSEDGKMSYFKKSAEHWLARPLLDSFFLKDQVQVPIEKIVYRRYKKVIILNCLDSCFGHILYKLFNAQTHLKEHSQYGLVLLIPKTLLWLVPEGVAEVWHVDVSRNAQLDQRIGNLDTFVKTELQRFEKAFLSFAFVHHDLTLFNFSLFFKTSPFSLDHFTTLTPQITFVCREDRFWLTNQIDILLYLASVKFSVMNVMRSYFVYRQNRSIRKAIKIMNRELKNPQYFVVGIGRTGRFEKPINDFREATTVSSQREKEWCSIYARSHMVIGVHGSNMTIPTSLAAGFINLLPYHKVSHLGEDITVRHRPQDIPFLARFLNLPASSQLVARHAVSMIKDFFHHYYEEKDYNADPLSIVERYRSFS